MGFGGITKTCFCLIVVLFELSYQLAKKKYKLRATIYFVIATTKELSDVR